MNSILILRQTLFFIIFVVHSLYCSLYGDTMIHHIDPCFNVDSNIYLLTGDRNVLIDTGTGLSWKHIISAIKDILGPDGKVDLVLLTHCHFDHIGGAPYLISAFGC